MRVFAFVCLSLVAGCGIPTKPPRTNVQMVRDVLEPIPEGHALVVFSRLQYGPFQTSFVFDDLGNFVGEVRSMTRLHVTVPAGKHTFVGWGHAVLGDYGTPSLVTGDWRRGAPITSS